MKQENITMSGTVIECLPGATFKVELDGMDNNVILCHISGKIRKFGIHITLGDEVEIEMSPYDYTKGRIKYRK